MQAKELMELANYRMEKAQECYRDAEALFGEDRLLPGYLEVRKESG